MRNQLLIFTLLTQIVLSANAQQPQTEPLGRLFLTQAERMKMDKARQLGYTNLDLVDPGTMLNGYVIRSNGDTTTWINRVPVDEKTPLHHLQVIQKPQHAPVISIRSDEGKRITLKVGDSVDLQSGQVHKLLDATKIQPVQPGR